MPHFFNSRPKHFWKNYKNVADKQKKKNWCNSCHQTCYSTAFLARGTNTSLQQLLVLAVMLIIAKFWPMRYIFLKWPWYQIQCKHQSRGFIIMWTWCLLHEMFMSRWVNLILGVEGSLAKEDQGVCGTVLWLSALGKLWYAEDLVTWKSEYWQKINRRKSYMYCYSFGWT